MPGARAFPSGVCAFATNYMTGGLQMVTRPKTSQDAHRNASMPLEPGTSAPAGFRFFVFTCRDPRSDFRMPLVEELRSRYETYYIWLKRRPAVTRPGTAGTPEEMSLIGFLMFIRRIRADNRINVYFNSTNTSFPITTLLLKLIASAGVWCLDMHDDLRYHYAGLRRLRTRLAIVLLRASADVIVHAGPTLTELFPRSLHLGNASHVQPLPHQGVGTRDILIIASFDERFDFDFLSELAASCPSTDFHLHGWTRRDDPVTPGRISRIIGQHSNLHYHGPYTLDDLPRILGAYRISFAPYRTNTELTRFIDPLRFYHCLNAGLEVISTDIPQARFMNESVHVVQTPAQCAKTLAGIQAGCLAKQPSYTPITWTNRLDRLIEILKALPRTRSLGAVRRSSVNLRTAEVGVGSKNS
jgi:hypothetical protein